MIDPKPTTVRDQKPIFLESIHLTMGDIIIIPNFTGLNWE